MEPLYGEYDYEWMLPLTEEDKVGKYLTEKIKEAKGVFKEEFEIWPNLLLIHPMSMRYISMYAYKTQAVVYSHKDNIPMMPNDPSMIVLCDPLRESGSFLVTTRKLLERSGIIGGIS